MQGYAKYQNIDSKLYCLSVHLQPGSYKIDQIIVISLNEQGPVEQPLKSRRQDTQTQIDQDHSQADSGIGKSEIHAVHQAPL